MSGGPRCPNHQVKLLSPKNGLGICPISGVQFTYTALEGTKKKKLDTAGNITEQSDYKVEGND